MSTTMTRFSDAVYQRTENYSFATTEFTRRELRILLLMNGKKTVSAIADILKTDSERLLPDVAKLVRLGLIQTEGEIYSADTAALVFSEKPPARFEYAILGKPVSARA
ncbi:MAG: hypothetical protein V2I36_16455 [Desulfopila sp.]|nr:hypothetical protein [Desulfopila sp.]